MDFTVHNVIKLVIIIALSVKIQQLIALVNAKLSFFMDQIVNQHVQIIVNHVLARLIVRVSVKMGSLVKIVVNNVIQNVNHAVFLIKTAKKIA